MDGLTSRPPRSPRYNLVFLANAFAATVNFQMHPTMERMRCSISAFVDGLM